MEIKLETSAVKFLCNGMSTDFGLCVVWSRSDISWIVVSWCSSVVRWIWS